MRQDVQDLLALNGVLAHISATDRSAQGWRNIHRLSVTGVEFKARFSPLVDSAKDRGRPGARCRFANYPTQTWRRLELPGRYYQRLADMM